MLHGTVGVAAETSQHCMPLLGAQTPNFMIKGGCK